MEKKPHKHAEVIKQWAEGEQIEYRQQPSGKWVDSDPPAFLDDYEYRVKPAANYPETKMDRSDFNKALGIGPAHVESCTKIANAAIRHALDAGQVVTREEFDKVTAELKEIKAVYFNAWGESFRPGKIIRVIA